MRLNKPCATMCIKFHIESSVIHTKKAALNTASFDCTPVTSSCTESASPINSVINWRPTTWYRIAVGSADSDSENCTINCTAVNIVNAGRYVIDARSVMKGVKCELLASGARRAADVALPRIVDVV